MSTHWCGYIRHGGPWGPWYAVELPITTSLTKKKEKERRNKMKPWYSASADSHGTNTLIIAGFICQPDVTQYGVRRKCSAWLSHITGVGGSCTRDAGTQLVCRESSLPIGTAGCIGTHSLCMVTCGTTHRHMGAHTWTLRIEGAYEETQRQAQPSRLSLSVQGFCKLLLNAAVIKI